MDAGGACVTTEPFFLCCPVVAGDEPLDDDEDDDAADGLAAAGAEATALGAAPGADALDVEATVFGVDDCVGVVGGGVDVQPTAAMNAEPSTNIPARLR